MKKVFKILFIIVFMTFVCFSNIKLSFAEENTTATQSAGQITTTVKSTTSTENELLAPTNIINILLIAVGIVLILLAIAIFIRLNR